MRNCERDRCNIEIVEVKDVRFDESHLLLVETRTKASEFFREDGTLHWVSASIDITARYFSGPSGDFGELVCHLGASTPCGDKVRLTNGSVMIGLERLRGLHIGSFMFGRIVDWAKAFPGNWQVVPISLSVVDARDEGAKTRRNTFYENFGIHFNYSTCDGIDRAEGRSDPALTVAELVQRNRWENIDVHGHWGQALLIVANRFGISRSKLRGAERIAKVYSRRLRRRSDLLAEIARHIQWILVVAAALAGYQVKGWLS